MSAKTRETFNDRNVFNFGPQTEFEEDAEMWPKTPMMSMADKVMRWKDTDAKGGKLAAKTGFMAAIFNCRYDKREQAVRKLWKKAMYLQEKVSDASI